MRIVKFAKSINCFLWNTRGWASKMTELEFRTRGYDVCLLTETKSKKRNNPRMRGFDVYSVNNYRREAGGAGGGVAILIRKNLKRSLINMSHCKNNLDVLGLKIQGAGICINILCLYRRPGKAYRKDMWRDLFRNINSNINYYSWGFQCA